MTYGYGLGIPLVCDGDVTWVTMLSWEALRLVCPGGFTKLAPCALFIFSESGFSGAAREAPLTPHHIS